MVGVDNDVSNEEVIAKNIMEKVRGILAAAQIDDTVNGINDSQMTRKVKTHEDIFRELIDNMERPLENKDTELFAPSDEDTEDDMGNIDYTEYQGDEYYYYSDNEDEEELFQQSNDKNEYTSGIYKNEYTGDYDQNEFDEKNINTSNDDNSEYISDGEIHNKTIVDIITTHDKGPSIKINRTDTKEVKRINVAFPELLKDLINDNLISIDKKQIEKEEKVLQQIQPNNVRVKKRARLGMNIDKSISDNFVENNDVNIPIKFEALVANNASVFHDPFKVDDNDEMLDENVLVHTSAGKLYGRELMISDGERVKEYLSIPYARPPTGELRFKSPQPAPHWENVRNTSVEHLRCWNSFASNSWEVLISFSLLSNSECDIVVGVQHRHV